MLNFFYVVSLFYISVFFFSSRRRHTRCALVTGVQTCALPISAFVPSLDRQRRPVNGVQRLYPRGAPPKPQPAPAKVLMGFIAKQRMIPLVLALPDQPRQIILAIEQIGRAHV